MSYFLEQRHPRLGTARFSVPELVRRRLQTRQQHQQRPDKVTTSLPPALFSCLSCLVYDRIHLSLIYGTVTRLLPSSECCRH